MKKFLTFIMFLTLGSALLTGCSEDTKTFTPKNYTSKESEIAGININVRDREIEVSLSDDNQIHISYFENDKEFYDISVSEDNVLTMTAANNKNWKDYFGGKSASGFEKISLQIPDALLSALTLTTTNEDISLSALTVQNNISISTNGGNITFDKINVGNELELTAKNGDIKGTILGGYDDFAITCKSKKGENNLPSDKKDGNKTLQVSSNNGDVDIQFQQ